MKVSPRFIDGVWLDDWLDSRKPITYKKIVHFYYTIPVSGFDLDLKVSSSYIIIADELQDDIHDFSTTITVWVHDPELLPFDEVKYYKNFLK